MRMAASKPSGLLTATRSDNKVPRKRRRSAAWGCGGLWASTLKGCHKEAWTNVSHSVGVQADVCIPPQVALATLADLGLCCPTALRSSCATMCESSEKPEVPQASSPGWSAEEPGDREKSEGEAPAGRRMTTIYLERFF